MTLEVCCFDIEQVPHPEYIWQSGAGFKADKSLLLSCSFTYPNNKNDTEVFYLSHADLVKYHNISRQAKHTDDINEITERRNAIDKELVGRVMERLNKADIIVSWYGKRHDIKWLNAKAMLHGIEPCVNVRHIDLYFSFRNQCNFSSNRLGNIANKLKTTFKKQDISPREWDLVRNGDYKALEHIAEYNMYDTLSLSDIYMKAKGLIRNHPHANVQRLDKEGLLKTCRTCGSSKIILNGTYLTDRGRKQRYYCLGHGGGYVW